MDINSQNLVREEETGGKLDLFKKAPKKDFKGVNFSSVTWCGEKSRVVESSGPGSLTHHFRAVFLGDFLCVSGCYNGTQSPCCGDGCIQCRV